MSTDDGARMYAATRTTTNERTLDPAELRRNAVTRGRALYRARHRDRDAREALAAAEQPDNPPRAAA